MNGAENPKVPSANPMVEDICNQLPHFGDAWEKHIFTGVDNRIQGVTIVMLIPPTRLGPLMKRRFFSNITLMTTAGPAQIEFEIPVATIEEAEAKWRECAQGAIREAHQHIQENQRRIVVPGHEQRAIPFPKKSIN